MTLSFTLHWWMALPIFMTLLLLAGGLWADRFAIDRVIDFTGTLFALALSLACWTAILYGRYERWSVVPILFTAAVVWQARREKLKYEARWIVFCILIAGWLLVAYGRLTA